MRTAPSAADRELIRRVRREHGGVTVSSSQLERWRHLGLLPRVQVARDGFGGTTVLPHPDEVVSATGHLARLSRRGRPWQRNAESLFNAGYRLEQQALGQAAAYLVSHEHMRMQAAWADAQARVPREDDIVDHAGLVGEAAARRVESLRRALSPRRMHNQNRRATTLENVVRREIELAHAGGSVTKEQLEDYVSNALTWRVVDLVRPETLTEAHRNLARHGVEEPLTPIGDGAYPLPSERLLVAQSLTPAEAEQYRPFAHGRIEENSALGKEDFGLLWVVIWIVAYERVKMRGRPLDLPLPQAQLDRAAHLLASRPT